MLRTLLHKLTFYILQKSVFERAVLLLLFFASFFTIIGCFEHEEWSIAQREQIDISVIHSDITALFEEYKIVSKCARAICTTKELAQRNLHTELPHTQGHYTLFFTCYGFACYEFVRALEVLPTLFIHEVASSNITILHDTAQQDSLNHSFSLLYEDRKEEGENIRWKQDMRILFSIGVYQT